MIEIAGKQITTTLAEIVEPLRRALLIWGMEYAIGPNAFNYQDMLPKLQQLSPLARSKKEFARGKELLLVSQLDKLAFGLFAPVST